MGHYPFFFGILFFEHYHKSSEGPGFVKQGPISENNATIHSPISRFAALFIAVTVCSKFNYRFPFASLRQEFIRLLFTSLFLAEFHSTAWCCAVFAKRTEYRGSYDYRGRRTVRPTDLTVQI